MDQQSRLCLPAERMKARLHKAADENAGTGGEHWPAHDGREAPILLENEVHVWRAPLDIAPEKLSALELLLSPDERARAARLRFARRRARFIAARGILRSILGIHLRCEPSRVRFAYGEHGKPHLAEPEGMRIEFNLSHSAGLALCAVADGRRVGIDVECVKPEGSWLRIAGHYFSNEQTALLSALPEEARREKFFDLWAEKEARLKATGAGLRFQPGADATGAWSIAKLRPMPGYTAALATEGNAMKIARHHFVA